LGTGIARPDTPIGRSSSAGTRGARREREVARARHPGTRDSPRPFPRAQRASDLLPRLASGARAPGAGVAGRSRRTPRFREERRGQGFRDGNRHGSARR
jgi:hypothetical protein